MPRSVTKSGIPHERGEDSMNDVPILSNIPMIESETIEACKKGDTKGWDILVKKYEGVIFKFAYSLSHNYDDAADITGMTLLKVYENIHSFRSEAPITSWFYCIVKNIHMDFYVRGVHPCLSLDDGSVDENRLRFRPLQESFLSPEAETFRRERHELIRSAIKHLPRYHRIMIELYHSNGKSYEEIAKVTGLSIGTVKSRMYRARQMLRERLSPYREIIALTN
jgi:RNA polymerase sigma-70 factor (ECF subfamily)